jgi:protein required for attachment to host cells
MHQTPRIHRGALLVVGDGSRVLFLRNKGGPEHLDLVVERELEQENPPTREQGTSPPGRYKAPFSVARSAFEETDWHQLAEDRFAHAISAALYRLAHAGAFKELIVVAPPKVLGNLRASFHKEVAERVVGEIPKDLTGLSVQEIGKVVST